MTANLAHAGSRDGLTETCYFDDEQSQWNLVIAHSPAFRYSNLRQRVMSARGCTQVLTRTFKDEAVMGTLPSLRQLRRAAGRFLRTTPGRA